ncbi:class I SAM-dependent methyltransferase [Chloroflexota bacterium]
MAKYEPATYWQERLSKDFSLTGVGCWGIGIGYNRWLYKARIGVLSKLLKKNHIDAQGTRVLNIGIGNGFYVDYWKKKGAKSITGIDITEKSVSTLSAKYPEYEFIKADISAKKLTIKGTFDIITAFDVLFHIVEEDKFEQAIRNIRRLSHPQTKILIMDSFLINPLPAGFHQNYRTLTRYQEVLKKEGIEMVELVPIFYFLTTPSDMAAVKNKFLQRMLPFTRSFITRGLTLSKRLPFFRQGTDFLIGHALGFLFYFFDRIILKNSQDGPSEKLLFAKIKE